MKVGDIIYDAEYPDELGFVFKIEPDEPEPYYVFCEGKVTRVDQAWVDEFCVVLN